MPFGGGAKMTGDASGRELLTQLETAIHRLVESFWEEPNRYYAEVDAHDERQTWVARPEFREVLRTAALGELLADGH
jgi:hypothetical protein